MLLFASGIPLVPHHRHPHSRFRRPHLRPPCSTPRHRNPISALTPPTRTPPPMIIGLNEYSHDTSMAIIHADTGSLLFAMSKERLTRRKHDGGDVSLLMRRGLSALADQFAFTDVAAFAEGIQLVIANNHHFRVAPFERRLPLQIALNYAPASTHTAWNLIGTPAGRLLAPLNLASKATKIEISHHLAHAYSAVYSAPVARGIVIVMDGMGDNRDDWVRAAFHGEKSYYSEERVCDDAPGFLQFPSHVHEARGVGYREAETAYRFTKDGRNVKLERLFKRWTPENEPPELPNHSFEEMDSVGAVYSRVAAIIFRDWNACGKVMGLAPYAEERLKGTRLLGDRIFLRGDLFDGTLSVEEGKLKGLDHVGRSWVDAENSPELRLYFENLAYHIQKDLEDVVIKFVLDLQRMSKEENVIFTGGVAQNSTLNGILDSKKEINHFSVSPYPGDEGIAVGCSAFGFYANVADGSKYNLSQALSESPLVASQGIQYKSQSIERALNHFEKWIKWRRADSAKETAQALAKSKVVAWFDGKSEFGPRALGSRSILADPRKDSVRDHVNRVVKKREAFRPFAPAVLAEHANEWFEDCLGDCSPFMSMTKTCRRPMDAMAVAHIDGTSRLQTVTRDRSASYYQMIAKFWELTGVPMVLNTSFNIAREPIVESPRDALRAFLDTRGIAMLVFPGCVVEKDIPAMSAADTVQSACSTFRSSQVQDSQGACLQTQVVYIPLDLEELDDEGSRFEDDGMPEITVHITDGLELELLEYIQRHGTLSVQEIFEEMVFVDEEGHRYDYVAETDTRQDMKIENDNSGDDEPTQDDILARLTNLFEKRLICKT